MEDVESTVPTGNRAHRRAAARKARRATGAALTAGSAALAATAGLVATAAPAGAATFTVENLNATGAGSLDQAIQDANAAGGPDIIDFAPGLTGTIDQTSDLTDINDDVDIRGPGADVITVDGGDASELFEISGGAASSISGLTIANGLNEDGGGVSVDAGDATLTNLVVTSNASTDDGGGLWCNNDEGLLTVRSSTVSGNHAADDGGGLYADSCNVEIAYSTFSGNTSAEDAGGLYIDGNALIRNSTIVGNEAGESAGGFYISSDSGETVTIANSTIVGNEATDQGGGVLVDSGEVFVLQSTITGNVAGDTTGGLYADEAGAAAVGAEAEEKAAKGEEVGVLADDDVTIVGTILAGNSGFDLMGAGAEGVLSVDHSLLGSVEPATVIDDLGGNLFDVADPGLDPLADNGGPTQTMALRDGSPALDAGPDPVPDFPGNEFDQRGSGFARVVFGRVDIGAYEVQAPEPIVIVPTFTG